MRFCVIGAGSWGTALAIQLGRNGHDVRLWGRDAEALAAMASAQENTRYLPGVVFPAMLKPEPAFARALDFAEAILIAVPSSAFRETLSRSRDRLSAKPLIWATKGLELPAGLPLHRVCDEVLGRQDERALLSGPSFAREVGQGKPTAVTMASSDPTFAEKAAAWFHGREFRVYTSTDVIGVELGGALKNVLAIAAGISDGLGFGSNARAALITRGLRELVRLAERAGARPETLYGLSGLGDLVLTSTDDQSRNRRLGLALAKGYSIEESRQAIGQAIEGLETAKVVRRIASDHACEMPICEQIYRVLYEGLAPRLAVTELLAREAKQEG